MTDNKFTISSAFWVAIIFLLAITISLWLFWPDIKKIALGNVYYPASTSVIISIVDKDLKQSVLSRLEKFKQYGEWPIVGIRINNNRGNPFVEKNK